MGQQMQSRQLLKERKEKCEKKEKMTGGCLLDKVNKSKVRVRAVHQPCWRCNLAIYWDASRVISASGTPVPTNCIPYHHRKPQQTTPQQISISPPGPDQIIVKRAFKT